jgi:hypothetical protein
MLSGIDLVNQRGVNFADPTSATDAANKQYVDNLINGLSWKKSVRAATTANGTLASAYQNAASIDGVTLATGDRILLKDQTTATENGIYTVNASGAPTRATDADLAAELVNAAVYVDQGTVNADKAFVQTANAPITIGSTNLVWAATGGGTTYSAGNGLSLASTTFSVLADPVSGGGISVTGAGVKVDTAVVVRKYAQSIGDGSTTAIAVTHSLGTKDITYSIREVSTDAFVDVDCVATSTTVATFTFPTAPASNAYRVVIHC